LDVCDGNGPGDTAGMKERTIDAERRVCTVRRELELDRRVRRG
jgi:hypothetical protein